MSTYFTQFVKKSALVPLILPLSYINYVLFKEEHNVIDVVKSIITYLIFLILDFTTSITLCSSLNNT